MADYPTAFNYMMDDEDRPRKGWIVPDPEPQAPYARARFGLNSYWHPDLLSAGYFTINPDATPKIPTQDALRMAFDVYRSDYWSLIRGFQIGDQNIANKYFSLFANCEHNATKIMQRACNKVLTGTPGYNPLYVDGACGPQTIEAINKCDPSELMTQIKVYADDFYRATAFRLNWTDKELQAHLDRANR